MSKSIRRIVSRAKALPFAYAVLTAYLFETSIQSTLAIVTADSLHAVGTINVGVFPGAMAKTPNGNYLYVCNYGSRTVSVINALLNRVTTTIPIPSSLGPSGIAITPDGATAFVLDGDGIAVISTSTNQVLKTISPGPSFGTDLAVTVDGTQLYVANFAGTVSIINVTTYQLEKTLTVGSNAYKVALSPDGKSAYVDANGSGGGAYLAKIDVATQTIVAPQLGAGHIPHGTSALTFSPDSQTVYAPEGVQDVLALNAVTGQVEFKVVLSTQPQFYLGGAQISPSGKYLYVVESTANAVVIINTLRGTQVGSCNSR